MHTLALAAADGAAAVIDVVGADPDDEAALAAWFADPTPTKVGHDLKPAINALTARGWPVDGVACDTALAAYLALPGQPPSTWATWCSATCTAPWTPSTRSTPSSNSR